MPRLTTGQLLLIVAASCIGLASLKGNHIWFMGLSVMTIVGLLGAALGASPDGSRPSSPGQSSVFPPV